MPAQQPAQSARKSKMLLMARLVGWMSCTDEESHWPCCGNTQEDSSNHAALTDMALLCCAKLCSPWVPAGHQIKLPGNSRDHLQQQQAHKAHTSTLSLQTDTAAWSVCMQQHSVQKAPCKCSLELVPQECQFAAGLMLVGSNHTVLLVASPAPRPYPTKHLSLRCTRPRGAFHSPTQVHSARPWPGSSGCWLLRHADTTSPVRPMPPA